MCFKVFFNQIVTFLKRWISNILYSRESFVNYESVCNWNQKCIPNYSLTIQNNLPLKYFVIYYIFTFDWFKFRVNSRFQPQLCSHINTHTHTHTPVYIHQWILESHPKPRFTAPVQQNNSAKLYRRLFSFHKIDQSSQAYSSKLFTIP